MTATEIITLQNFLLQQLELISHATQVGNNTLKALPSDSIRAISIKESLKRIPQHHKSVIESVDQLNSQAWELLKEQGINLDNLKKDLENILKP